jgi:hypothetical protein
MDKKTKESPVEKPELPILDDASLKNVDGGGVTDDWNSQGGVKAAMASPRDAASGQA